MVRHRHVSGSGGRATHPTRKWSGSEGLKCRALAGHGGSRLELPPLTKEEGALAWPKREQCSTTPDDSPTRKRFGSLTHTPEQQGQHRERDKPHGMR